MINYANKNILCKKIHTCQVFTVTRIILYYHEVPTLLLFN